MHIAWFGGNYINKMSNYCKGCANGPKLRTGESACPFNYLYWDFLKRNEKQPAGNPRMGLSYKSLARLPADELKAVAKESKRFLAGLSEPALDT